MKTFFNLLLMMAIAMPLMHAQKDDLPSSKWTLDMEIGIPLQLECKDCFSDNPSSIQYSSIGASYRLDKWWALTANITCINYENITQNPNDFTRGLRIQYPNSTFSSRKNHLILNLGGQALIRLGQGDLFWEGTIGLGRAWGNIEMIDPDAGKENYTSNFIRGPYVTNGIGYIYWPINRLGITLKANRSYSFVQSGFDFQFFLWTINLGASYRF